MIRQAKEFVTRHSSLVTNSLPLWTLLLVVLLASASLWGPGIVNTRGGGDSPFLLQRLHQMVVNLRAGVFPVRWMPDAAYGLGYPFFNYYSALPFYLAASFNLLGLDPLTALKLTQTLGFLIAALAMFGWVHHLWRDRAAAWLAAIAYTVAPFHLVNVYVRGDSLSEFYAFAWYPLILWALERVVRAETRLFQKTGFLALAYAGLILSHNISAFIFSPFVLLYLILLVLRTVNWSPGSVRFLKPLGLGLVGLLLGLALSAWAWLPALLERDYVQSETLTGDYFHYANHFRAANLVQPSLPFDYSIEVTTGGPSPFAMGGPQALVAVVGLFILLRFILGKGRTTALRDERRIVNDKSSFVFCPPQGSFVYLLIGLLLSTAMITPLSRPLWDHLPLLATVQFPWRFLSVQALFAAVAAAVLVLRLRRRLAWGVAGAVAALLIASTLLPLRPERLPIGPDDVTATRLQEYELFTGNIGTTIRYEWLPQAAVPRPFTFDAVIEPEAPPQTIPLTGKPIEATQTRRRPIEQVWRVQADEGGATLAFPLLYWPGWRAWVDGKDTPVWAVEGAGYLALEIPPGEHTVRLKLGRTPLRGGAETLSLVTFLILLAYLLLRSRVSLRNTQHATRNTQHAAPVISSSLILLTALLFLTTRSSPPPNRLDDLTMDFVAMPYLHHNPGGVDFTDQARLLSYALSADQLNPGDALTVTLNWDNQEQTSEDVQVLLRLVSPAEHLPNDISSYTLAEATVPLAPITVHRLTVPENIPRGLYLLQLGLQGPNGELSARTPSGAGRGPLYLRPVRVIRGAALLPDAPVLALVGPDIRLRAAALEPGPKSTDLTVRLEWSTARRLVANYGVSVRLLDPDGVPRESRDTQPGYGLAPTSLWRPGERIADRYTLPLPDNGSTHVPWRAVPGELAEVLPPDDGYRLLIVFYRFPSLAEVARVGSVGPFALPLASPITFEPPPRLFELPSLSHTLDVDFTGPASDTGGDQIRLAGYDLKLEAETLNLTLWWIARRQPQTDYTVFLHLFDPATEVIAAQHDAMPRQGSYPTSGWLAGEVVSDTVRLPLSDVPPGAYRLALGLYQVATDDRLPAVTPDGAPVPNGRLILPDEIEVPGE